MSRRCENWLLVEWSSGGRDIVHVNAIVSPKIEELKIGVTVTLPKVGEREPQTATLISRARNRDQLRKQSPDEAGPSPKPDDEPEDYSPSGSSWAPSDDDDSGDSDQQTTKKIKLENCTRQYINRRSSKKIMTPSHRAKPVIPKIMQQALTKKKNVHKITHNGIWHASLNKSLPDSTKTNNTLEINRQGCRFGPRELADINNTFCMLFQMIEEMKRSLGIAANQSPTPQILNCISAVDDISTANETAAQVAECEETAEYENEEFNRSNDNVLITNKYDNQCGSATPTDEEQYKAPLKQQEIQKPNADKTEWIPIGSGKTLIHVDQFRKVKWKSFTVATRSLLLAVFPRRVLATHCLTGKKSPAFQNKPAKMCLDPKIISDVIIEIMDRFNVKENLVRGIITTKCADECKMWKQRAKKKLSQSRSSSKSSSNQENEPPSKEPFGQSNNVSTS